MMEVELLLQRMQGVTTQKDLPQALRPPLNRGNSTSKAGARLARPPNCPGAVVLSRCALCEHFVLGMAFSFSKLVKHGILTVLVAGRRGLDGFELVEPVSCEDST